MEDDSGDMFKYKLGKWVLSVDECAFTNLTDIGKNKSMRQYLIESIDSWVNKKEPLMTDKVLYDHLVKKCALEGISIGEGIFKSLSLLNCGMTSVMQCNQVKDDLSDV